MAEVWYWVDADGGLHELDVEWDVEGAGIPPVVATEDMLPEEDGSRVRDIHYGPRELAIPIEVRGTSEANLRTKLDTLTAAFNPGRGVGHVRVITPTRTRQVEGYLAEGFTLQEKLGRLSGDTWEREVIVIRCPDPYWRALTDTVETVTAPVSSGSFFPFSLPWRVGAGVDFGNVTITNDGDGKVWPVWDLYADFTAVTVTNTTTGAAFTVSRSTTGSEVITVDTRVGMKSVKLQDGTDLFSTFTGKFFELVRGVNAITITTTGDDVGTKVVCKYKPGYLLR